MQVRAAEIGKRKNENSEHYKNLISYTLDYKTTDMPYFMFVLNISICSNPMTAYAQADLSQALSAQLTRQRHGA